MVKGAHCGIRPDDGGVSRDSDDEKNLAKVERSWARAYLPEPVRCVDEADNLSSSETTTAESYLEVKF